MLKIIFISTLIVNTFAQLVVNEKPDYKPMANFKISKFIGKWYEIARFPNMYEQYHSCSIVDYTLLNNGTLDIKTKSESRSSGQEIIWSAYGDPINQYSSELNIRFPTFPLKRNTTWALLDTDYENYSVILMIQNTDCSSYWEYVWILSRKRLIDQKYLIHVNDILSANNIETDQLEYIYHDNCPNAR